MADADERLEPYLAFRDGMSLSRIATTYGIANVRRVLDTIERGLDQLEREKPYFNRELGGRSAQKRLTLRELNCLNAPTPNQRHSLRRQPEFFRFRSLHRSRAISDGAMPACSSTLARKF